MVGSLDSGGQRRWAAAVVRAACCCWLCWPLGRCGMFRDLASGSHFSVLLLCCPYFVRLCVFAMGRGRGRGVGGVLVLCRAGVNDGVNGGLKVFWVGCGFGEAMQRH